MSHKAQWAIQIVKIVCAAIIFAATLQTILIVGPWAETKFWPPVSKLQILTAHATDADETEIQAYFTKRRDCEYIGISWFRGAPDGQFERVPIVLLRSEGDTSSPNRPVGTQKAGPWIISLSSDDLTKRSFARLYHRCNPFWITTTDFYP